MSRSAEPRRGRVRRVLTWLRLAFGWLAFTVSVAAAGWTCFAAAGYLLDGRWPLAITSLALVAVWCGVIRGVLRQGRREDLLAERDALLEQLADYEEGMAALASAYGEAASNAARYLDRALVAEAQVVYWRQQAQDGDR